MYAIVYKRTNRYYIGETWSRLDEDFGNAWGKPGDTKEAVKYETREAAEKALKYLYSGAQYDCGVVEVTDEKQEEKTV